MHLRVTWRGRAGGHLSKAAVISLWGDISEERGLGSEERLALGGISTVEESCGGGGGSMESAWARGCTGRLGGR